VSTQVVVGRLGRAHGLRGEVVVEPRTDEPERRFAAGVPLRTESQPPGRPGGQARTPTLTVAGSRWHQNRLLVRFEGVTDRAGAETLRGLLLITDVDPRERPEDPAEFYDHQLTGLRVHTTEGEKVGEVVSVVHTGAQDLLTVRRDDGGEVLVPFVTALVPRVDLDAGTLEVADRPGLLRPDPVPDPAPGPVSGPAPGPAPEPAPDPSPDPSPDPAPGSSED
jgi:16S rRNA processing protein RimM